MSAGGARNDVDKTTIARVWRSAALTGLLWLVGCQGAVYGDWYLVDAKPNRQTFAIDNATFNRDSTYSATTTIEGVTNVEKGTYDFDGIKLRMRPQAGGQRTYTVQLLPGQLQVGDAQRHVLLQKGKRGG
jgi:hypothetical protein